ncbi:RagB/SusD family nutrient uptake outer membrane protein [Hyphobacterium sp. CCMP332]|nr:RagB/SusD family nutrient uptake outer membrane protein [Hyphobacterium sp. CCMP332]
MKTLRLKYFAFILLLISISACREEFLERPPLGSLTDGTFPATSDEAISATNGVYNSLRQWQINTGGFPLLDIMSDESRKGSNPGDGIQVDAFDNFSYTPSEEAIENWYRTLYQGIRRSHLVIERVPNIADIDDALKTRLIAEARFLRGYFYSILYRGYRDVPLVTTSEAPSGLSKTAGEQIFNNLIEPDLLFALENLPLKSDYSVEEAGRATKGSAAGLLARLYLFRGNFVKVEQYSLEVINSGQYSLEDSFSNAFSVMGEFGPESVFEVGALPENSLDRGGNQYANTQGVRGTPNFGWGFNRPSYQWIQFMGNDPRMEASIFFLGEIIDGETILGDGNTPDTTYVGTSNEILEIEVYNQKVYATGEGNQARWGHNRRIIRYSDILLMAAEAMNENNKASMALPYLNMVRERADAGQNILPNITTTDKNQLRDAILEERHRELFLEGLRFWDLVRTGRAADVLGPLGFEEGKHEIFPMPQSEIDISQGTITQAPEWQ